MKRLVVENTIEERMLRLQDVKMGARSFPFSIRRFKKKINLMGRVRVF